MASLEIKNQIVDVLKEDYLDQDEKISALTVLLSNYVGFTGAESKAKEVLHKYIAWENYLKKVLNNSDGSKNLSPYYNIKYFDLIKFYGLHHNVFDKITNEQIKDGILETKKLRNMTVQAKGNKNSGFCPIFGVNVILTSVPDLNQTAITFNRFIAVLGYMNAVRGIKAESSLSMQINWMCCSEKVRSRKHLFFHGMEDLLASIAMGTGKNFDPDDIAFLYGGCTLMSYLSFCNTVRKENPNVKIMPLENWMKKPADKYSFKGKYPDLVARIEDELNDEGRELICNIFKNAIVMLKDVFHSKKLLQALSLPTPRTVHRGGYRPRQVITSRNWNGVEEYEMDSIFRKTLTSWKIT